MSASVEDITPKVINDYTLYLLTDKNYAPYSRRRIVIILKAYFTYAYNEELTKDKLSEKILSVKTPRKERKFLTVEEVQEFLSNVENRLIRLAITTMYYTGMRVSECCNLKMEDVDMRNRIIHVVNGKGGKDRPIPMIFQLLTLKLLQKILHKQFLQYLLEQQQE
jgi:integrase